MKTRAYYIRRRKTLINNLNNLELKGLKTEKQREKYKLLNEEYKTITHNLSIGVY